MGIMVMCLGCGEFRPAVEGEVAVEPVEEACRHCGETDYRYLDED